MSKRIAFSDPVKLTILYGDCTVSIIVERQNYDQLNECITAVDAPVWVTVDGMINDFDANAIRICIKAKEIVSIECVDVNS